MEKEMITMMGKMMEQMNEVQTDVKEMKTEMNTMKTDISTMKIEINTIKTDMTNGFDKVNKEIVDLKNEVKTGFYGVRENFEGSAGNSINIGRTSRSDINFLIHKITQMEKDIYMLTPR